MLLDIFDLYPLFGKSKRERAIMVFNCFYVNISNYTLPM